jgi:hypothetical protein
MTWELVMAEALAERSACSLEAVLEEVLAQRLGLGSAL